MMRIAFYLNRPAITNFHERAAGGAAPATSRREPTRHAGREFNRLLEIRDDLLLRRATTAQGHRRAGVSEDCEKCSARDAGNGTLSRQINRLAIGILIEELFPKLVGHKFNLDTETKREKQSVMRNAPSPFANWS